MPILLRNISYKDTIFRETGAISSQSVIEPPWSREAEIYFDYITTRGRKLSDNSPETEDSSSKEDIVNKQQKIWREF